MRGFCAFSKPPYLCKAQRSIVQKEVNTAMNSYELLYIIDNALSDEAKEELVNKFNNVIVKANGSIDTVDKWGAKKLAYDIDYKSEGYYVLINFKADSTVPAEVERNLKITDGVMRYLVIKK